MEKYEFLSRTGEGAYGSVWRARDKNTGMLVAVKKMKDVPTTEEEAEVAMREVKVLQMAKHVNIVNLLEAYKSQSGRLYLVFEYVERTLLQELKANRGGLPPAFVKSVTWQLLQSLSYLHRKQIIHRDVKPSNILLTEEGVLKICDFGFARACSNTSADPAYTTYVVTRWYRAPEVLVGDTYGPPVDVWALGCIFAEMLAGRPLFPGKNHHDQLWLILKCLGTMTERQLELLDADPQFACFRLPTQSEVEPLEQRMSSLSAPAMQFLRACLNPDPKQRATADELLDLPYFQGVSEALPLDDLFAYPDADLRAKLERVVLADQAASAAAAAARDTLLQLPTGKRSSLPGGKPASPARHRDVAAAMAHPSKAASAPKLEQRLDAQAQAQAQLQAQGQAQPQGQRPPLQRFVTAPPASMAAKVQQQHAHQQAAEHGQRSRPSTGDSQQGSPGRGSGNMAAQAAPLVPPRGRSWRMSGDGGGGDLMAGGGVFVRQLSGTVTGQAGSGMGYSSSAGGDASRPGHDPAARGSQRATWNGTQALPRGSHSGSAASSLPSQSSPSLNSSFGMSQPPSAHGHAHEGGGGPHRKSHSLAGNEQLQLPPAGGSMGPHHAGLRGPQAGLGGVQGRSLAPQMGAGTGGPAMGHGHSSLSGGPTSSTNGFQLPPPQYGTAPGNNTRLSPSPPSGAYGGSSNSLRPTNSVPMASINAGTGHGRMSNDGGGGSSLFAPGRAQLSVSGVAAPQTGAVVLPGALESEASEASMADASAYVNDGRRASDTVLYAAAALKEAKHRLDKASHIISRPPGLLEGPNGPPPNPARAPSFTRRSGTGEHVPSSPDGSVAGTTLPPLLGTPRRISAPEPTIPALLPSGPGAAPLPSGFTRSISAVAHPPSGSGHVQRHPHKQQQQHPQQYADACDGADAAAASAHLFLPVLDVGSAGKSRAPSMSGGPAPGVGVGRRPSKGSLRAAATDAAHCKREEGPKGLALEAVPEGGLL